MRLTTMEVDGVFIIDVDRLVDDRGFFGRTFADDVFADHGLPTEFPQHNISHSSKRGTLRGMHFEIPPSEESKIVRCTHGEIFDVVIDVRPDSPTFCRWCSVSLSRDNCRGLFVPSGCAHGFLTMTDDVDVHYAMGSRHRPGETAGVRWDDPTFGVQWPFTPIVVSSHDATYSDFSLD